MKSYKSSPTKDILSKNKKTKKIWDVDERKGMKFMERNSRRFGTKFGKSPCSEGFWVQDRPDGYLAVNMLNQVEGYMNDLFVIVSERFPEEHGVQILLHTPHILQEMPVDNFGFDGLNKPKDIVPKSPEDKLYLGLQDNSSRAGYRRVILQLRNPDGTIRDWDEIKKLILHEFAHTMCNHLMFREDGNHMENFKHNEKILILASEILGN